MAKIAKPKDLIEQMELVDYIKTPDELGGQSYTFSYDALTAIPSTPTLSDGWGEISEIERPSGASIDYEYALDGEDGPANLSETPNILKNHPIHKVLGYKLEYDGSSTSTSEQ